MLTPHVGFALGVCGIAPYVPFCVCFSVSREGVRVIRGAAGRPCLTVLRCPHVPPRPFTLDMSCVWVASARLSRCEGSVTARMSEGVNDRLVWKMSFKCACVGAPAY